MVVGYFTYKDDYDIDIWADGPHHPKYYGYRINLFEK